MSEERRDQRDWGPVSGAERSEIATALALLEAGDWQAAHLIVQQDEDSALACWAHGIVHLMEGDVSNAHYWYVRAGREFPQQPQTATELAALKRALTGR
ncbi:MAG: hypothetical protein WD928_01660 [Gammaproteobacteria bacterium]